MGRRSRLMVLVAVGLMVVLMGAMLWAATQPKAAKPQAKAKTHAAAKGGGCSMSGESGGCSMDKGSGSSCSMGESGGCSMHQGKFAAKRASNKAKAAYAAKTKSASTKKAKPAAKAAKPKAVKKSAPSAHAGHAMHMTK